MVEKREIHTNSNNMDNVMKLFLENKNIPKSEKDDVEEFIRLCQLGKINKGKKLSTKRCKKIIYVLRIPLNYFKKDTSEISVSDVEKFDSDLMNNKLRTSKTERNDKNEVIGFKPFSDSVKVDIRKILKTYLRWKIKNKLKQTEKFENLTDWFDITPKKKSPNSLSDTELKKILELCKDNIERTIISVMVDSGCRIGEFLNIRQDDIITPTDEFPYYQIRLRDEFSKTDGRTIGLYWDLTESNKHLKKFLSDKSVKRDELLFPFKYTKVTSLLKRIRIKLKLEIPTKLLRNTSATHYSTILNRQQLCMRYGWKFSSRMPDTYIRRSGIDERDVMNKFKQKDKIVELEQNKKQEQEISKLHLKLKFFEDTQINKIKEIGKITEELKRLKDILKGKGLLKDIDGKLS